MTSYATYPEPAGGPVDTRDLLARYLDYYRDTVLRKLDGMSEEELRTSRLPSGWAPVELVEHLAFVERRWFRWGYLGEDVDPVWGEEHPETGRWHVPASATVADVRDRFVSECARSREVVAAAGLHEPARTGGRFTEEAPELVWILLHVLQEYARHMGQLDVVRELADGAVGE
ncbi:uncharacterized protein DUF664 [Haloactinospora alba]|uniref:Uncharacterized protein DUF664 n=1 Tax=Haloactinospora alba TaxID=405555 RepID=A0A543NM13_9ACTN|nr:DinB family protein [Haloactinospora alba]TQN32863.1 uncharacterized protein DUF664 [Haloactinospora alba]